MNLMLVVLAFALSSSAMASDLSSSPLSQNDNYSMRYSGYYSGKLNKQQSVEYGYGNPADMLYEPDYLAPGSAGSNPNVVGHISPASRNKEWDLKKSDRFEIEIYRMVCVQKITYCGSTAHDIDKQAFGIQTFCAWKSLSSWTWIWSCRLK